MPQTAQQRIHQLFVSSGADQHLISDFELFHKSVDQKLWSTNYFHDRLLELDVHMFYPRLPRSETLSIDSSPAQVSLSQATPDMESYCRHANLYLDGFLMNAMSVLDTLAHEIATLYCFGKSLGDIYIRKIKDELLDLHPNSRLGSLLDYQLSQRWFVNFEPYRHCTTHESLIRYEVHSDYDQVRNIWREPQLKLPDDPQARPFTYIRRRELRSFCTRTCRGIESLITRAYRDILRDIHNSGNILPIPLP